MTHDSFSCTKYGSNARGPTSIAILSTPASKNVSGKLNFTYEHLGYVNRILSQSYIVSQKGGKDATKQFDVMQRRIDASSGLSCSQTKCQLCIFNSIFSLTAYHCTQKVMAMTKCQRFKTFN